MLRYYEEQGLLEPQRTPSGYRTYAEADVDRVARIRCMLSAALPAGVVGQALTFLLDGRAVIPELPEERARLAATLQAELDALNAKIASLENSRDLLATILADVQDGAVGPGDPGDAGSPEGYTSVRKAGPGIGSGPGAKVGSGAGARAGAGTRGRGRG